MFPHPSTKHHNDAAASHEAATRGAEAQPSLASSQLSSLTRIAVGAIFLTGLLTATACGKRSDDTGRSCAESFVTVRPFSTGENVDVLVKAGLGRVGFSVGTRGESGIQNTVLVRNEGSLGAR